MKLLLLIGVAVLVAGLAIGIPATRNGAGAGEGIEEVRLTVTRDFGTTGVGHIRRDAVTEGETVMRLLQSEFEVETRYGGGFVQSIEGFAGGRRDGRAVDWFYYVNGIESEVGAAERQLFAGDRVWWDLRDWEGVMRVPAVVGSFPEPFLSGIEGRRLPVRVDCAEGATRICDEVTQRLEEAGTTALARGGLRGPTGPELLRVVVGPWSAVRTDPALRQLEDTPESSGVFARFRDDGARLDVYDERAQVVRSLEDGAGLVAAVRYQEDRPTWVVTGTDAAGASAAAGTLREDLLARRYAVAIEDGTRLGLPIPPPGERP